MSNHVVVVIVVVVVGVVVVEVVVVLGQEYSVISYITRYNSRAYISI